jgi:O-antigen/teichoic acid export membrane protein
VTDPIQTETVDASSGQSWILPFGGWATRVGQISRRDRRALITAATSVCARLITLGAALATVRLSIGYLGAARYGLWMTVTAVTVVLAFSDLGIGNAIINRMSVAFAADERVRASKDVSSATAILSAVALVILLTCAVLLPVLPWPRIYNVVGQAASEAGPTTLVFVACFAVLIPLGLVQKVQLGFQEGAISNLWTIGGALLSVGLLIVAIKMRLGLPWLVLAVSGGPVLSTGLNWIQEFVYSRPWLRPRLSQLEPRVGVQLARTGGLFLGLQVAGAVAFSSDNFIAAQLLGPVAVAQYSVTQRLFLSVPALVSVAAVALWPAYGEALVHADRKWIRRTLLRSSVFAVGVTGIGGVVLVLAAPIVFGFLVGPGLIPPIALTLGFLAFSVVYAFGNVVSMLLNAANVIAFQLITASAMAVTSIVLKIELGRSFGVAGIIWGTVIAYTLISILPIVFYIRYRRRIDW